MGQLNTRLKRVTALEDGKVKVECRLQTSPDGPWYDVCEELSVDTHDSLRGIIHRAVLVHFVRRMEP